MSTPTWGQTWSTKQGINSETRGSITIAYKWASPERKEGGAKKPADQRYPIRYVTD